MGGQAGELGNNAIGSAQQNIGERQLNPQVSSCQQLDSNWMFDSRVGGLFECRDACECGMQTQNTSERF